ncbi:MAG: 4Fe-4S binding protein [Anaerolineales bacterium]|nr:4Fe-4S binding protein [Anaerolineales bacterium]
MSRPLWFVQLIKKSFPARFFLARATKVPLLGGLLERWLFQGDDLIYLPRERTITIYEDIERPVNTVLPSQVVDHFIEQANDHWIMHHCLCRESNRCQDYPIDLGCLFMGEAVKGINPALGRLATREEAHEHVRRCREAGLVHLVGRNRLDTVWLGVSPGEKLLTVCNCCPCCCLWKILPLVSESIAEKVERMPGVTVTVTDLCQGCGTCTQGVCFVDAIRLVDGRAVIGEDCRGCGRCAEVCPNDAIEVSIAEPAYVHKTIERISSLVDLT